MAIKSRLPLGFNRRTDGRGTDTALAARFGPNDSISLIGAGRTDGRTDGRTEQWPKEGPKPKGRQTDGRRRHGRALSSNRFRIQTEGGGGRARRWREEGEESRQGASLKFKQHTAGFSQVVYWIGREGHLKSDILGLCRISM